MAKKVVFALLRLLFSTAFSGLLYIAWMAIAIPVLKSECCILDKIILWILAPFITAFGFTVGVFLVDLIFCQKKTKLWDIYKYPLAGCIIGAVIVVFFGPMLIVFGMFALGGLSIIIREVKINGKRH